MNGPSGFPDLLLFGGPLHKLGVRLRLIKGETGTFRFGMALGLPVWAALVGLAFWEGLGQRIFSLATIGVHVRILLAIPLLFACEAFVGPVIAEFARNLRESRLVPEAEWPALAHLIRRVSRLAAAWPVEVFLFLAIFAMPLIESLAGLPEGAVSWTTILGQAGAPRTLTTVWYLRFCLPLFRFLILRWLWRLGLWWYFLWRLRKRSLQLVATHSDGAGGLGFLSVVQEHFVPLVVAIASILSASFAEAIRLGTIRFESLYALVPGVLVFVLVLFVGPLFLFTRKLWDCRVAGLDKYMAMATRYVQAFERRWIQDPSATGESQLGTGDLQSLADLTNSMDVIRGIRLIPGGGRLTIWLAACAIAPMLPLVLLKYPVNEVVRILLRALAGM